jgi:hypothetical protein
MVKLLSLALFFEPAVTPTKEKRLPVLASWQTQSTISPDVMYADSNTCL